MELVYTKENTQYDNCRTTYSRIQFISVILKSPKFFYKKDKGSGILRFWYILMTISFVLMLLFMSGVDLTRVGIEFIPCSCFSGSYIFLPEEIRYYKIGTIKIK